MRIWHLLFLTAGLLIFISSSVLAVSIDSNESYQPKETIIFEVKGDILSPIEESQVEFFRRHVSVPFEYGVGNLEGKHFIWVIAGEEKNNYTLSIKDLETRENGSPVKIDFEKNFSISGETIDYNVAPGAVFSREDFSLEIFLFEDSSKEIEIDYPTARSVLLNPGDNRIDFSLKENKTGFQFIQAGKYSIPAYLIEKDEKDEEENKLKSQIDVYPRAVRSSLLVENAPFDFEFNLINKGTKSQSVEIYYNKSIFSISEKNLVLEPGENKTLNLTLSEVRETEEILEIKFENETIRVPLSINLSKSGSQNITYPDNPESLLRCSEIKKGTQCTAEEFCEGETRESKDGLCCIGSCIPEDDESSLAWVGWLIAGVVLIIGLIVYYKYKKAKPKSNPLKK